MEDWIFSAIAIPILILMPIIGYIKKCILNYNLFKKVGWIISTDRARHLPQRCWGHSLLDDIVYKQQNLKIPMEYRLNLRSDKTEKDNTEEILEVFKKYISEKYFGGFLSNDIKIRNLGEDWYFMYSLFEFSSKYSEYDNLILRDKIYKYESRNGSYYTYTLTDYGRTFYKIYLISLLYVENNPHTRKLYKYIDSELKEFLKSYLNSNEITFWRYRP